MKKLLLAILLTAGVVPAAWGQQKIHVVATQTIFADLVKTVGGDKVEVSAVASPKYNVHFIQPKPSDVRRVSKADLYVNAGLDLEAWSDPLLEAAGRPQLFRNAGRNVDLSQGIRLLDAPDHPPSRAEGDIHLFGNPHFHMDPRNARPMIKTILAKLTDIDPSNADYYRANAQEFLNKLDAKIEEWKLLCQVAHGREVIAYHADIAYFAQFAGFKAEEFLEPKPGVPPTPKHIAFLGDYAKEHGIKAILMPTFYSRAQAQELARRIGAKIAVIAQGAGEVPGTEDFFSFFDYNVNQIKEVFSS